MIGVVYIILGILYTIACVMDGPDVKPVIKSRVGKFMWRYIDNYYKIPRTELCTRAHIPLSVMNFDIKKIDSCIVYGERELHHVLMFDRTEKQPGIKDYVIKEMKERCAYKLLESIIANDMIQFHINEPDWMVHGPKIVVDASIFIGVKH